MKFGLVWLFPVLACSQSCWGQTDASICKATISFDCEDQCPLYKTETNCPDTCEWVTETFFGVTTSTCRRKETDDSCSAFDEPSCIAITNCAWTNPGCTWKNECQQDSSCLSKNEAECSGNPACIWEDKFGDGADCWTDYDNFDGTICEKTDSTTCGGTSGCEWYEACEEKTSPCEIGTKADCTATDGCFWAEIDGTMEASFMGQTETSAAKPECMDCFLDIAKVENVYEGFKAKEKSGCSVYGEMSLMGMSVDMKGSVDILSVTAGGACTGGTPQFLPPDMPAEITFDCSYPVGEAPMGNGAGFLLPSLLTLVAAIM